MYALPMETMVSDRGQTAVPAKIRKRFGIKPGQKLVWAEDGKVIYILPVVKDPISAFRGSAKNKGLLPALLKSRQDDVKHRPI